MCPFVSGFSQHDGFKVQPHCSVCQGFVLYGWVMFCVDVHFVHSALMGTWYLYLAPVENSVAVGIYLYEFVWEFWGDLKEWNCWVGWYLPGLRKALDSTRQWGFCCILWATANSKPSSEPRRGANTRAWLFIRVVMWSPEHRTWHVTHAL